MSFIWQKLLCDLYFPKQSPFCIWLALVFVFVFLGQKLRNLVFVFLSQPTSWKYRSCSVSNTDPEHFPNHTSFSFLNEEGSFQLSPLSLYTADLGVSFFQMKSCYHWTSYQWSWGTGFQQQPDGRRVPMGCGKAIKGHPHTFVHLIQTVTEIAPCLF